MAKTEIKKGPAQVAAPQPAVYKSLGLNALFQKLEGRTGFSVLDLGPACGTNIAFWSQFQSKLYVEDLHQELRPVLAAGLEEDAPSPFPELLPYPEDTHFDVVLAWDVFNYIPQSLLPHLASHLARFCPAGAFVFALMIVLPQMPAEPNLYRIVDSEHMIYDARATELLPCPRYQPRDVARMMSGYSVSNSFLLRHGVQEYLFEKT
jgi:hypothetical protein